MYITDDRVNYGTVALSKLGIGDAFMYEEELYIKIEPADEKNQCCCCFSLGDTPWTAYFDADNTVTPVEIGIRIFRNRPIEDFK